MCYVIKTSQTGIYVNIDVPEFRDAQNLAFEYAQKHKEDVLVINDDDNAILCIAVIGNRGDASLSLCTTGSKDTTAF
jgi:hypothetical protein